MGWLATVWLFALTVAAQAATGEADGANAIHFAWALIGLVVVSVVLYQYGRYTRRKFDANLFFNGTALCAVGLEIVTVLLLAICVHAGANADGAIPLVLTILGLALAGVVTIVVLNVQRTNFFHGVLISAIQFIVAPVLIIGVLVLRSALKRHDGKAV